MDHMTSENRAAFADARTNLYRFLSDFYLNEPVPEQITQIRSNELLASFSEIFSPNAVTPLACFAQTFEGNFEDIKQEYHNLFLVPLDKYLTPYESVHREGMMMRAPYLRVCEIYKSAGVDFSNLDGRLTADHIGVELDFMRVLCEKEASRWKEKDISSVKGILELEERFLSDHLTAWIGDFCKKMEAMAEIDLFRGIARITLEHVLRDRKDVKALLAEIEQGSCRAT